MPELPSLHKIHARDCVKRISFSLTILGSCFFLNLSTCLSQEWGRWISLGGSSEVDVSISFRSKNNCGKTGGGGYSYYRTLNNTYHEGGTVFITFSYTDCDGRAAKGNKTVYLSETGVDEKSGYWFLCNGTGVRDIRLETIYLPEKKIWRAVENGVWVDIWKRKYGTQQDNASNRNKSFSSNDGITETSSGTIEEKRVIEKADSDRQKRLDEADRKVQELQRSTEAQIAATGDIGSAVESAVGTIFNAIAGGASAREERRARAQREIDRWAREDEEDRLADEQNRRQAVLSATHSSTRYEILQPDGAIWSNRQFPTTEEEDLEKAEAGDLLAQTRLGERYLFGKVDEATGQTSYFWGYAFKWFRNAAERGHADAQYQLGWMYENVAELNRWVPGEERSLAKALYWYGKAVGQGEAAAYYTYAKVGLARLLEIEGKYAEALKWYKTPRTDNGYIPPEAVLGIGYCYEKGLGVTQSYSEAARYYKQAENESEACLRLGLLYRNGYGVAQNTQVADQWFKKAIDEYNKEAEFGGYIALFMLSHMHGYGYGVPHNNELWNDYFEQGIDAIVRVKNPTPLILLANRGIETAQFKLGLAYYRGDFGLPKDLKIAKYWIGNSGIEPSKEIGEALQGY